MERIAGVEDGDGCGDDADDIPVEPPFEVAAVQLDADDMLEQRSRAEGDAGGEEEEEVP